MSLHSVVTEINLRHYIPHMRRTARFTRVLRSIGVMHPGPEGSILITFTLFAVLQNIVIRLRKV